VERSSAQLDGDFGALRSDVARLEEAIGESRLQMVSLDRQVIEEVATQLREVQVRLDELQPRLFATRERLTQSVVRAPSNGRVVGLKVFTVGGVVAPGEMLMEIVPQDKALVVLAKASPNDADDLSSGMQTQVRFSGIQERSLPILMGQISKVSADSFEDNRTGMEYFEIEVVVPPGEMKKIAALRGENSLRAGMPAEVMVPLRERTALGYLIEPLTQTLWRAGREH
jgi:HlyD family secretion protein